MIGDDRRNPKGDDGADAREAETTAEPTREQIARRAYERYLSRSGSSPDDDWYAAERELRENQRPAERPEEASVSSPPPSAPRVPAAASKKASTPRRATKPIKKPTTKR